MAEIQQDTVKEMAASFELNQLCKVWFVVHKYQVREPRDSMVT